MSVNIASQFEAVFNAGLRLHPAGPTVIAAPETRPWEAAKDADILLVRPSSAWREVDQDNPPAGWPGRLRWIYCASVGIDVYPRWLLDAPIVSCGRGIASEEIADYVIAAIYTQTKNLEQVRARSPAEWRPTLLAGVNGSTIGIVGLGSIGTAVARRAVALGARVTAARRRDLPSVVSGVELLAGVAEVAASSDHIVLALPATDETHHLVDAALLQHVKPTAHLINIARGAVIDQEALVASLDEGRLAFATLDVTDPEPLPFGHKLWNHPRVRLTPHISSNFGQLRGALMDRVADNLDRFLRGEMPHDVIDRVAGY